MFGAHNTHFSITYCFYLRLLYKKMNCGKKKEAKKHPIYKISNKFKNTRVLNHLCFIINVKENNQSNFSTKQL